MSREKKDFIVFPGSLPFLSSLDTRHSVIMGKVKSTRKNSSFVPNRNGYQANLTLSLICNSRLISGVMITGNSGLHSRYLEYEYLSPVDEVPVPNPALFKNGSCYLYLIQLFYLKDQFTIGRI